MIIEASEIKELLCYRLYKQYLPQRHCNLGIQHRQRTHCHLDFIEEERRPQSNEVKNSEVILPSCLSTLVGEARGLNEQEEPREMLKDEMVSLSRLDDQKHTSTMMGHNY